MSEVREGTGFLLGRDGQAHRDGLVIGIVAMSPDPRDPAARLAVHATGSGAGIVQTVRPGDVLRVGEKKVRVVSMELGQRGHVGLVVEDDPASAEVRP